MNACIYHFPRRLFKLPTLRASIFSGHHWYTQQLTIVTWGIKTNYNVHHTSNLNVIYFVLLCSVLWPLPSQNHSWHRSVRVMKAPLVHMSTLLLQILFMQTQLFHHSKRVQTNIFFYKKETFRQNSFPKYLALVTLNITS